MSLVSDIFFNLRHCASEYCNSELLVQDIVSASLWLVGVYVVFRYRIISQNDHEKNPERQDKKNGWILTTFIAVYSSVHFLLWIAELIHEKRDIFNDIYGSHRLAQRAVIMQLVYFVLDCLGMRFVYPLASDTQAWIHHILFMYFMGMSVWLDCPNIFLAFYVVEIPTIMLGVGRMFPHLRVDLPLIFIFFVCRICLHSLLIWILYTTFAKSPMKPALGGSCASLGLHCYWLYGFVRNYTQKKDDGEVEFRLDDVIKPKKR
jgi:hypothetical protein